MSGPDPRTFAHRLHLLLRAAHDKAGLERLFYFQFKEPLEVHCPTGEPLDTIAFGLLLWAEQRGKLVELVRAVAADRPRHPGIVTLAAEVVAALDPTADRHPHTPPPGTDDVLENVGSLIRAFERIRLVMPEGDQRTVVMEGVVTKLRALPLGPLNLPGRLHLSASEGERLAATVALRVVPDPAYLRWLAERILVEYSFCGYQAAAVLRKPAYTLPVSSLGDVATAVQSALDWLENTILYVRIQCSQNVHGEAMQAVITPTTSG